MRLRSWVVLMTGLLAAIPTMADTFNTVVPVYPSRAGGNYSGPRWYGYYFNNGLVSANADHTNITEIGAPKLNDPNQVSDAIASIISGLKEAKDNGKQAMVDVEAIVFNETGATNNVCYGPNPTAVNDFQTLVTALEHPYPDQPDVHYLIPRDPVHSTVSSFYIADEPDRSCNSSLQDTTYYVLYTPPDGGQQQYIAQPEANPILTAAITVIRDNQDTANFPLATTVTETLASDMPYGLSLFDWIGLDDYGNTVPTYLHDFTGFEANALAGKAGDEVGGTPQYFFMVPLVSLGVDSIGVYTDVAPIQARFDSDNNVIGIMPFKWRDATDSRGMNATSSWAPEYIALGKSIVGTGSSPPSSAATIIVIMNSLLL